LALLSSRQRCSYLTAELSSDASTIGAVEGTA
jgi:hypothetical protein